MNIYISRYSCCPCNLLRRRCGCHRPLLLRQRLYCRILIRIYWISILLLLAFNMTLARERWWPVTALINRQQIAEWTSQSKWFVAGVLLWRIFIITSTRPRGLLSIIKYRCSWILIGMACYVHTVYVPGGCFLVAPSENVCPAIEDQL